MLNSNAACSVLYCGGVHCGSSTRCVTGMWHVACLVSGLNWSAAASLVIAPGFGLRLCNIHIDCAGCTRYGYNVSVVDSVQGNS